MDDTVLETKRFVQQLERELADVERFSSDYTVPAVLELAGKLGALNRSAISLIEAAAHDREQLEARSKAGDLLANEARQRLMLELRDLNSRVEKGLDELAGNHAILSESLNIIGEVVAYLKRMRELLSEELWQK